MKPEKKCVLETVQGDGSIWDTPTGRTVNPGHAIETSWFLLEEARRRGDSQLLAGALQILEWSLEMGWDPQYGGILYFVDCDGKQPEPYEWDMKLWWPHNEALYATLLAHHLTGDAKWATWYERLHAYTFSHFPDREVWRVVWVPAPRRHGLEHGQGQHVEGALPPAADAALLLEAAGGDERRPIDTSHKRCYIAGAKARVRFNVETGRAGRKCSSTEGEKA